MSSERASYDRSHGHITPAECASMRMLADDGWTPGELKMTFQLSTYDGVQTHVEGHCSHEVDV